MCQILEVKRALEKGRVIIALGSTNAFVAEEILGKTIKKALYISGHSGHLSKEAEPDPRRYRPFVLVDGKVADISPGTILSEFKSGDVFIKGANAVDSDGNAGILLGDQNGGTIGAALAIIAARRANLVVPVGLEKRVCSIKDAAIHCHGIQGFKYSLGVKAGFMPLINTLVVTEVEALKLLTGVKAFQLAAGGIDGLEGTVVLAVEGNDEEVLTAFELIKSIKGEPPVS